MRKKIQNYDYLNKILQNLKDLEHNSNNKLYKNLFTNIFKIGLKKSYREYFN